jgi:hypothetical protein
MASTNQLGGGARSQSYLGTKADNPPNVILSERNPTTSDVSGYALGDLWLNKEDLTLWSLVNIEATIQTQGKQVSTWSQLNITQVIPLPIANGGTNAVVMTDENGVIYYDGTSLVTTTVGTAGQVLTSNGTGVAPTFQDFSSGNITLTGDSGGPLVSTSFTISGSSAGSSVSFAGADTTLSLHVTDGSSNTILGQGAGAAGPGSANTAFGVAALGSLNGSAGNTAIGTSALSSLSGGNANCGIGNSSLNGITSGTFNTALGSSSGDLLSSSESSCIYIGYSTRGSVGVSNRCRIGTSTGTGIGQLNSTFIAGIAGINVTGAQVLVSSGDQLGVTVSSRKYKENIQDMGEASADIYQLRPVTFSLKNTNNGTICYGLIAEEVAEIFPSLIVHDNDGNPQTIKYQDLPVLLLNEIKKIKTEVFELQKLIRNTT